MKNDCALLLSSYDGGIDLWEGFFKSISYQWKEFDLPVIINTESLTYSYQGFDITVLNQIDTKKKIPWSKRLMDVLSRIDTEFILFFLEDFWLDRPVRDIEFRKTLQYMRDNPDVATFSFYPCNPGENIQDERFEGFELRPQKCTYKINCQASIWRTKKLLEYLRPHETPWEFEVVGSVRAERYAEKFYTLKKDTELIFSYGDPDVGCLIHRGKWNKDVVLPLAKLYNLDIDYSKRGFENWEEIYANAGDGSFVKPSLIKRLMMPNLGTRVKERIIREWRKYLSLR
jgi:hypothetical protein